MADATVQTVDLALTIGGREVVLIRRLNPPFQDRLCLPGGHVDPDDASLAHACVREAAEEIHFSADPAALEELCDLDAPDRDPRGPTISKVFHIDVECDPQLSPDSDARVIVIASLRDLGPEAMGFDHWKAIEALRTRLGIV
ncbi:MAG: NUDIX domain-containing protein [Candidatus Uhrbacteria bacterium]